MNGIQKKNVLVRNEIERKQRKTNYDGTKIKINICLKEEKKYPVPFFAYAFAITKTKVKQCKNKMPKSMKIQYESIE